MLCGGRGCLTGHRLDALAVRAQKLFHDKRAGTRTSSPAAVDAGAIALLEEIAGHLGQVLVGVVVNVMNPAAIVLGGEICGAAEQLLDPLQRFVRERSAVASFDAGRITMSRLGPQSIAVGAATLHLDEALRHPERFLTAGPA